MTNRQIEFKSFGLRMRHRLFLSSGKSSPVSSYFLIVQRLRYKVRYKVFINQLARETKRIKEETFTY